MRISDWSSDVCSSDLLARRDPCIGPFVADHARGLAGHRAADDGICIAAFGDCFLLKPFDAGFFGCQKRRADPRAQSAQHHRCGDSAAIGDSTRSEEHTSELQSLMRISYAVFCLKKKKQKDK